MSKYKSFRDSHLDKKLTKLEQDIKSLKVKQLYGMQQVQSFTSNKLTLSSAWSASGWGAYENATNIFHLRFTGNKPNKTVICRVELDYHGLSGSQLWVLNSNYVHQCPGDKPNEWEMWVYFYTMSEVNNNFTIDVSVQSNETGVLKIVDEYPRSSNEWISGG